MSDIGHCWKSTGCDLLTNQAYKTLYIYIYIGTKKCLCVTSFHNIHALLHVLFHWYFLRLEYTNRWFNLSEVLVVLFFITPDNKIIFILCHTN